jgi:hypothetical protein
MQQTLKKRSVLNDERPIQAESFAQFTGIVSTSRRMRYLSIEMETLHQFGQSLTGET